MKTLRTVREGNAWTVQYPSGATMRGFASEEEAIAFVDSLKPKPKRVIPWKSPAKKKNQSEKKAAAVFGAYGVTQLLYARYKFRGLWWYAFLALTFFFAVTIYVLTRPFVWMLKGESHGS